MDKSIASQQPPQIPSGKGKPAPGHFRPSRVIARWWWLALIVFVCIVGTAYKIPEWFNMREPLYESSVLLEVKPIAGFDNPASMPTTHGSSSFIATQEAIIQATATLELALQQKDLLNRLGGNQIDALERMKKSLTVSQSRGTDLIEISYRDEDPLTAQDTVIEIYKSYAGRRRELEMKIRDSEMKALQVELQNQSDRVVEVRKRLMDVSEKAGVVWVDENGVSNSIEGASLSGIVGKDLYEANRKKEQLAMELKKLLSIEDSETLLLLHYESDQATPQFTELYKTYEKTNEEIQALRVSGVGERHPELVAKEKTFAMLKEELLKKPMAMRKLLKLELKALDEKIIKLKGLLQQDNSKSRKRSEFLQSFSIVRKEYQAQQEILDGFQGRFDIARINMVMSVRNHTLHQEAQRPTIPVTKGRDFFTTLFTLVALPLAAVAAMVAIYLLEVIFPRRMKV